MRGALWVGAVAQRLPRGDVEVQIVERRDAEMDLAEPTRREFLPLDRLGESSSDHGHLVELADVRAGERRFLSEGHGPPAIPASACDMA